jgi:hypothetical protein
MKRTLPLFVLIAAIGLLVPVLAVFGEPPSSPKCQESGCDPFLSSRKPACCVASCPSANAVNSSSDNDKIIDELTAILKETKSAETFLVTAMVLGRMGPEAKRALPIILRNAERLELFDDLYKTNASGENRAVAQEVIAALEMILDKKAGAKGRIWGNQAPHCYTPATGYSHTPPACPPADPASADSPTPWNAPTPVPPAPPAPSMKPVKPPQAIAPSTN